MTVFYAQPYDISATGFYFETIEEFRAKQTTCRNDYGQPVEEFEIQLIEADDIDILLFEALRISQDSIGHFIDRLEEWNYDEKLHLIIAVEECGCRFSIATNASSYDDILIYEVDSLEELAEQFVEEGLYGNIPKSLQYYIDYQAIASDLSVDFSMTLIDGKRFAYGCY